MNTFLMPPHPEGTPQQQLQRQYAYLCQMAQQLNLALQQLGGQGGQSYPGSLNGRGGQETVVVPSIRPAVTDEEKQQYDQLKSLILRTAEEIRSEMDRVELSLQGQYVAVSDFGTYLQQMNSTIEGNAEALTQYYSFVSDLQRNMAAVDAAFESYRVETGGYIRTGIVYYDGAVPVYGVAVGQDLTVQEIDGETVVEQKNFRATYTASKLSFWQDATEVAYVSNNRLYISNITVLEGLTLGRWEISTDNGLAFKWIGG